MIPMAKGSAMCNLGQIGGNLTKLSIKASMKMMKWESVAMEKLGMQGFKSKWMKLSQVMLEHGNYQIMQGEALQKKRILEEKGGELSLLAWDEMGAMEWLNMKPRASTIIS